MQDEARKNLKSTLSQAIARGDSITAWAERNEVPLRTAFRWSRDPKVRRAVQGMRRHVFDRAIGRMSGLSIKAVNGVARLAKGAESESVQLRAWRAILADQMTATKFADLEERMAEIEEQIRERTGNTASKG